MYNKSQLLGLASIVFIGAAFVSAQSPPVQPASETDGWGQSVDGIQLHLAVSKTQLTPTLFGLLPGLEVQIRNRGIETVPVDICGISEIEVDGIRYTPAGLIVTGGCPQWAATPGTVSGNISVAQGWMNATGFAVNGKRTRSNEGVPSLHPGKHSIRVIARFKFPHAFNWLVVSSNASVPVMRSNQDSTTITLMSNAISVEVQK